MGECEAGGVGNKFYESLDASRLLTLLSFPAVDPREVQARDSNRKQLNGLEDRTTLRAI